MLYIHAINHPPHTYTFSLSPFLFTFPWISAGQIHGFQLTITNTINIAGTMNALATRLISVGLMDTWVATAVYYSDTEVSISLRHFRHRISVLWVLRYWTDSNCDSEWSELKPCECSLRCPTGFSSSSCRLHSWRDYVPPFLQALRSLPVQARTDYNLSAICHNISSSPSSAQLSDFLVVYTPSRH